MRMIGIDQNSWLVFDGVSNYGHGVWPTPVISIATLIEKDSDWGNIPQSAQLDCARLIFREDSFDPVSRVRRGRLYEWNDGALQQPWFCAPHPTEPPATNSQAIDGRTNRYLYTYRPARLFSVASVSTSRGQLVLGTQAAPTVWRIVSTETIISGEEMITLHARSTFGSLPDVLDDRLPEGGRDEICALLDKVADAAFRSSPAALIDLCRAASTVVLAFWLDPAGDTPNNVHHLDLGGLLKAYERAVGDGNAQSPSTVLSVIRLFQRFHSRGKPNEQKRYGLRPPTEEDAKLVLNALGFLLREFGWAR